MLYILSKYSFHCTQQILINCILIWLKIIVLFINVLLRVSLATWYEELTHWKRPWCWERFKAGREGDNRGLNGWKASPTQWTWVWASSGCWWWTWRPGMLQSMGLQRVRHDWETELNWLYFITVVWEMHRTTTFFKKTGAHLWHPWFIKYIEVPLPLPSLPCFRVS